MSFVNTLLLFLIMTVQSFGFTSCDSLKLTIDSIFYHDLTDDESTSLIVQDMFDYADKHNCDGLVDVYNLLGLSYYNRNELSEALKYLLKADSLINPKLIDTKTSVRNKLYSGLVDLTLDNPVSAKLHFLAAERIGERINFTKGLLQVQLNMAFYHITQNELHPAKQYLLNAQQLSDSIDNKFLGGFAYKNMADVLLMEKNYKEANWNALQSLSRWEPLSFNKGLFLSYVTLARVSHELADIPSKLQYWEKAIYYEKQNESYTRWQPYIALGNYYFEIEDYSRSESYFNKP